MQQRKVSLPIAQWQFANGIVTLLQAEIAKTATWCKDPKKPKPDLVMMLANWVAIRDVTDRLKETPIAILPEQEDLLRKNRVYTFKYLKEIVSSTNGMMKRLEEYVPELYQSTLSRQLFDRLGNFRSQLFKIARMDDDELESVYAQRDILEYVNYAVDIIRLDYPRLEKIDFPKFQAELIKVDDQFRRAVGGKTLPISYSPETFGWRREK